MKKNELKENLLKHLEINEEGELKHKIHTNTYKIEKGELKPVARKKKEEEVKKEEEKKEEVKKEEKRLDEMKMMEKEDVNVKAKGYDDEKYLRYIEDVKKDNKEILQDFEKEKQKFLKLVKDYNGEIKETDDELILNVKGITTRLIKAKNRKLLNYDEYLKKMEIIKKENEEAIQKSIKAEEEMMKRILKDREEEKERIKKKEEYIKKLPKEYTDLKLFRKDMMDLGFNKITIKRGVKSIEVSNSSRGINIKQKL